MTFVINTMRSCVEQCLPPPPPTTTKEVNLPLYRVVTLYMLLAYWSLSSYLVLIHFGIFKYL